MTGEIPGIALRHAKVPLGDGYVDALRASHKEVPDTADLVCYWWDRSASLVASGASRRFGLITTNSIVQDVSVEQARAVLEHAARSALEAA